MRTQTFTLALALVASLAIAVGACGGDSADEPSPSPGGGEGPAFRESLGSLSIDASPGDNTATDVGPIAGTADVTDSACNDGTPEITLDLVMGDPDGAGEIPTDNAIAGWQARIQFDPNVLTLTGFQVSDPADGPQFFMEKASDQTATSNDHITVANPQPTPGTGTFDIGSLVVPGAPGAVGTGLLARLLFDCVDSGGTCINIGDADNSFYTDIARGDHRYEQRNGVSLGVNGGAAPSNCQS